MPTLDKIVCDFNTARSILKQSDNFDNLSDLCETYAVSIVELEGAILFYGLPYPTFLTPLERRIKDTYREMKKARLTQPELAKYYGTTVVSCVSFCSVLATSKTASKVMTRLITSNTSYRRGG